MIIDTHSHIGRDFYFGESKIEDYDNFCVKNNIDVGFLMPMPWPVYSKNGVDICSLLWEHYNYEKINYYKFYLKNNKKETIIYNPYEEINKFYYEKLQKYNSKTKVKFIPLVHGKLDNPYYLENMIRKTKPVAIKFHGFSGGFFADDINGNIVDIIKFYDMPIIIHTSVYKYNDGYGVDTKYFRNKCSPKNWYNFLKSNNLKGVLNHGACLDEEIIKKVNSNKNIMIGIGPDYDIASDPYKVLTEKKLYLDVGYLNLLKNMIDPEKLLFDVDYNWNFGNDNELDNDSIKRIRKTWNYLDSENILGKNAKAFYRL